MDRAVSRYRIALAGSVFLAAVLAVALFWSGPPAEAQVSGFSGVSLLDLKEVMEEDTYEARFHLASGIAITQTVDLAQFERLLQAATAIAQPQAGLFVQVEKGRVTSWYISVR